MSRTLPTPPPGFEIENGPETPPAPPAGFVLEGAPPPPAGFTIENQPAAPGIVSNTLRNMGERGSEVIGNLLGFGGTMAKSGGEAIANLTNLDPGVAFGDVEKMRAHGYEPDVSLGGYGLDFTARMLPSTPGLDTALQSADRALSSVDLGYQPTYTWENLKQDPGVANLLGFIVEQGVGSAPDMAASLAALPAYVASRTQETAETRAANDGRTEVGAGDLASAAPSAIASAALERIGAKGVTKIGGVTSGKTLAKETGKAAAKEAGTEFVQENIDYAGESVGTKAGYDPKIGLERGVAGAVAGGGVGGGVRGTTAAAELAMQPATQVEAAPSADIKESAVAANQVESTPVANATQDRAIATEETVRVETNPQQPVPANDNFQTPYQRKVEEFQRTATEAGLTPEQAAKFAPREEADLDPVTGFYKPDSRVDTLQRAQQHVAETGKPAVYVEADVANLGGMNATLGNSQANEVYRAMTDVLRQELESTGATVVPFRHGGDEVSAIVVGTDPDVIAAATQRAEMRAREIAAERGLAEIEHPKYRGDVTKRGAGLNIGISRIASDIDFRQILSEADRTVELRKVQKDVNRESTEAVGPGPGAGAQSGEIDRGVESNRGATAAVPEETAESEATAREIGREVAAQVPVSTEETTQKSTEGTQSQVTAKGSATEALETVAGKDGIVLLNAGIPLDQAVKQVAEASKPFVQETAGIIKDVKDAVSGKDSDDRQGSVGRAARAYFYSTHSNVRATADRFKESKALRQIADHFGAMPGEDTGVGQDLLTEAATHATANHNKLGRIVEEAEAAKIDLAQVAKMVRNPKSRQGKAGELAVRIEQLLKAELAHMREAGVEIGEVREGYLPRVYMRDKMLKQKADFISQAERMYAAMGESDPRQKAEAFWFRKVYGDEGRPGQQHAASKESFSKERVLDDNAEKFLGDYLDTNLNSLLFSYFTGSARRAAIARRFGDRWLKWPEMEAQMKKDGVPPSVVDFVRDSAEVLTGIKDYGFGNNALGALSWIRTFGTLGLLDKAALTSLGELWMPTLRASGDLGVLSNNLKTVINSTVRSILRMKPSERQQAMREFAEDIGEVAGNMMGRIMADRWSGGDVEGGRQARAIDAFFRRNLLTQLTEYNITIALGSADIFLRRLARDIAKGGSTASSSKLLLRELGIPAGKEVEIAKFVQSLNGKLPDPSSKDVNHRLVINAMQRFARQSVMRPDRGTRPKWANHPIGAVIFQLQSFTSAFQKNVINRQARLIGKAVDRKGDLSPQDRLRLALGFAPGFALIFLTQALVGEARDEIFSPDVEKTPGAKAETALARTGFFGQMEPFIQMVSGTRYNRGVLQQLAGPTLGGMGDAIDALFRAAVNNSDDTITAERGVVRAVYDLLFEPFINLALAPYGGGLVPTAITVGALPAGRDVAMDAIAGEQEKKKRKPRESVFEMLFKDDSGGGDRGRSGRSGRSGREGRGGR